MTDLATVQRPGDHLDRPAPLCRACQNERNRWLDTRPSQMQPRFGFTHGSGAPYDVSAAGLRDRSRANHEEWRQLVRFQRDLIARTCREQGHADVSAEPVPAVVQLPLFDLLEGREAA